MFGGFKNTLYLCQRLQDDSSLSGRAHVSRSAYNVWAFLLPKVHPYNGCLLVRSTALRRSHHLVTSGKCSRFSVSAPVRIAGWLQDDAIMNKLEQLMKEANSLKSYATELEFSIAKVDAESIAFGEKQSVSTTMKNAVQEMRQVAELLDVFHNSEIVSKRDAAVLNYLKLNTENFRKQNDQLSVVLGELVKKLDFDGTGIDIYLLHYISDAMETLRAFIDETKDIEYGD